MTPVSLAVLLEAVRQHLRVRLGVSFVLAGGTAGAIVLLLAWLFAGPAGWRAGTPLPLLLVLGGGVALVGLGCGTVGYLRRWTAEQNLAGEIERVTQVPEGAVRAQAELSRSLPPGVSASLARAGESVLLRRIGGEARSLAGAPGRTASRLVWVSGGGLLVTLPVVLLLFFLAPDRALTAWAGLAHPGELLVSLPLPPLDLRPGDAELPRGEEPLVEVVALGRDSVTLHWKAVGEVEEARPLGVVGSRATLRLPALETEVEYWASSPDGARTDAHLLTPSDPSLLADLLVEVMYPPHTHLPQESFRGAPEALMVPQGTLLRFTGGIRGQGVQGQGASILLRDSEGAELVRFPVEAGHFAGALRATRSVLVEWVVEGGQGGGLLPRPTELEVIPDQAPRIAFPDPGGAGELPLSLRLPILLDALDDYGVSWIEVETGLRDESGAGVPGGSVDRIPAGDLPSVILHPTLDFTQWGIRPGEQLVIRARVADNAPVQHVVESATYVLRMPRDTELREIARARLEEVAAGTAELLDRSQRDERALRDLERRTRLGRNQPGGVDPGRESFEERQEVQQAMEQQAQLARAVESLRERLSEAGRSLAEEDQVDLALADRIEELARLLDEVLGPEARERLEELLEALQDGGPPEELAQAVGELATRQQEMREGLEEMLNRLKRSVLEESMRGAEEELRSLADTQVALVDSLRMEEGLDRQQEVARRAEALDERLGRIARDLRAEAEPEAADQTTQAEQEVGQAREAMQEAAEETAQGNAEAAGERASDGAEALAGALDMLQEARAALDEEWRTAMREGLQRGAEDALALARRQGELRNQLPNAGPSRRSEFDGEEAAIRDGLRNLATALSEATVAVPDVGRELSESAGRAMAAAEQALEILRRSQGRSSPQAEEAAETAQRALNELALRSLAGRESQGEGGQSGSTMNQIQAEIESIAAAQRSVNRGSSSLGQDPGQGGATGQLEQLSTAQGTISDRLSELARRPGSGRSPGSLESLSNEANEIAEELGRGRLDGTLERQSRFLDLLLSAGRTLERDEPTNERESRTAGIVERAFVSPIPDYLLEARAMPLPSSEELEALSPAQRRLVLEYFERVNSRRARGDGEP